MDCKGLERGVSALFFFIKMMVLLSIAFFTGYLLGERVSVARWLYQRPDTIRQWLHEYLHNRLGQLCQEHRVDIWFRCARLPQYEVVVGDEKFIVESRLLALKRLEQHLSDRSRAALKGPDFRV